MAEKGTLTLSDGDRTLETVGATTAPNGVWLAGFEAPIFEQENTYAESESSEGARRIRTRDKNAMAKATWYVGGATDDEFWDAVDNLQELIQSIHDNGGTLAYAPAGDGDEVTFEVVSAQITDFPQRGVLLRSRHAEITAQFECKPYAMLTPVEIVTAAVVDAPVVGIVIEDVTGYVRARGQLDLTEQDSVTRQHIEVGVEEDYDPLDPAPLFMSLNTTPALVIAGFAGASTTRSGSYATNVVRATLTTTPVVVCGTGPIPGTGLKKIRARVYGSATDIRIRASWRVGDAPFTSERWVTIPAASDWYDVELAVIKVDPVPAGDHSYEVRIEAYAVATGDTVDVDIVMPFPAAVYARASAVSSSDTAEEFVVYDDFSGTAGPLTGDTSSSGDVWASSGGLTDADDFQAAAGDAVSRAATGDAGDLRHGRIVLLGSTDFSAVDASVDLVHTTPGGAGGYSGVVVRHVDNDNFVVGLLVASGGTGVGFYVYKVVAGVISALWGGSYSVSLMSTRKVRLTIDENGYWAIYVGEVELRSGNNSALAIGGTLETGKSGIIDWQPYGTAQTRTYSSFVVATPTPRSVIFADGAFRLTHESAIRESDDGTLWGRVPAFDGQYLTIPPATRVGRDSRLAVKVRRRDVDSGLPCLGGTDECLADLTITPRARLLGYTPPGS